MTKLNYKILKQLAESKTPCIEVCNVDVKRLHDDRSEIQVGEEIAFVATATFRVTQAGATLLGQNAIPDFSAGDELLVIGPDAELRAEHTELDEDSARQWLADHYTFTFLLNGAKGPFRPVGNVRVAKETLSPARHSELPLPWFQKLSTAAVKDDYIDVDVHIEEITAAAARPVPVEAKQLLASTDQAVVLDEQNGLAVTLEMWGAYASRDRLDGKTFRMALRSLHPEDDDLELRMTVSVANDDARCKVHAPQTKITANKP